MLRLLGRVWRPIGPIQTQNMYDLLFPAALKAIFNFVLGPPYPRWFPGEGSVCHFLEEIVGFGPIPARIPGVMDFYFCILALRAAGFWVRARPVGEDVGVPGHTWDPGTIASYRRATPSTGNPRQTL